MIKEELKKLPTLPGIYIFKDKKSVIIYVGKANNLKNRVQSYFRENTKDPKVKHIHSFEYIVTDTEIEAFVLENNLIKLHMPKYNIRLKDDRGYPYIKITKERFPRVLYSHKRYKDRAKYYGPFVSSHMLKEVIELVHKIWPFRRCNKIFPRDFDKNRPCLNHHIGQCPAPCNRLIDEEVYNKYITEVDRFIQGKSDIIIKRLQDEMEQASINMEFEKAADLRDKIHAILTISAKQKVESGNDDRDVIALARQEDEALVQIYFIRDGKLMGREFLLMTAEPHTEDKDILSAFLKQFYSEAAFVPKELSLISPPSEKDAIAEWLGNIKGQQVIINIPQKGEKYQMVKLAQTNAELTISQFGGQIKKEENRNKQALEDIKTALNLNDIPTRIEAYDISNIQGYESVGSMIVFEHGRAKKSDYRKYKIRTGHDDYSSMKEVLERRLSKQIYKLPDIIFVDGGKGQVSVIEKVLESLDINILVVGMVKDDKHRTRGLIYKIDNNYIEVKPKPEGFKLATRIQDEVHRFALEYHRKLRLISQTKSILDEIEGIGPKRRKALLKYFKSIDAIKTAELDELNQAPTMNKTTSEKVYKFFRRES